MLPPLLHDQRLAVRQISRAPPQIIKHDNSTAEREWIYLVGGSACFRNAAHSSSPHSSTFFLLPKGSSCRPPSAAAGASRGGGGAVDGLTETLEGTCGGCVAWAGCKLGCAGTCFCPPPGLLDCCCSAAAAGGRSSACALPSSFADMCKAFGLHCKYQRGDRALSECGH